MQKKMLKTDLNPSKKHLDNIEEWLIEEDNKSNEGFYHHWSMISNAFDEKRLIIITKNDYAIGFVIYNIFDLTAKIDIAEIKPIERKKGIAKKLINGTLEYFKAKGILVTELFCSPENSEPFWKKVGFINFPKTINYGQIKMYRPTITCLDRRISATTNKNVIQLWESHNTEKELPKYVWELEFENQTKKLIKPIILPVSGDWYISINLYGNELIKTKVKRVRDFDIYYGGFLIITELNPMKTQSTTTPIK